MMTKDEQGLVKDVVCGMVKPKSQMPFKSEFGGKTYYFCSRQDKGMFDAYPDRWATPSLHKTTEGEGGDKQ